jgi:hypothetical protein
MAIRLASDRLADAAVVQVSLQVASERGHGGLMRFAKARSHANCFIPYFAL